MLALFGIILNCTNHQNTDICMQWTSLSMQNINIAMLKVQKTARCIAGIEML